MIPTKTSTVDHYHRIYADVCEFTDKHYTNPDLVIDDFCKEHTYSKRTIERALQNGFNTSWKKIIINCRLVTARGLMVNTNDSLWEIGIRVGYKSYSHFARSFKAMYGKEPSEYRRLNRRGR